MDENGMEEEEGALDAAGETAVHLLDMGSDPYGDCILCRLGERTVLIDGGHPGDDRSRGGHPSIPWQLAGLLGEEPFSVDLLVVTHAHSDHIGCLPALVRGGRLRAEWALVADPDLGWGRAADSPPGDLDLSPAERRLLAALREENRQGQSDAHLQRFMADAADLELLYRGMLERLAELGTSVVRWGRDDFQPLLNAFSNVGLRILGPSQEQLLRCAEEIAGAERDNRERVRDLLRRDVEGDEVSLYRTLAAPENAAGEADRVAGSDALDGGEGPARNNQSIVMMFEFRDRKLLFTGDMQFEKPQVSGLADGMEELRRLVEESGPYHFVKMSHHGSYNAFGEETFAETQPRILGISTGRGGTSHPHPVVRDLLDENQQRVKWVRTDTNGLSSIYFGRRTRIETTTGDVNDLQPNPRDFTQGSAPPQPAPVRPQPAPTPPTAPLIRHADAGIVEVIARVPHTATRVTITIDVQPQSEAVPLRALEADRTLPALEIGGGRQLPPLLVVTSRDALAANIGIAETEHVLRALRVAGLAVLDELPSGLTAAFQATGIVRERLSRESAVQGVLLLGGYDVVPPQRLDVLEPDLRERVRDSGDPDDFLVWSDAVYGDRDGDGLPEVPVSRIPDGRSSHLVMAALQARGGPRWRRGGIRNVARPFAHQIFAGLPGTESLLVSAPTTHDSVPPPDLAADLLYLMLHGSDTDGTRFWGEGTPGGAEAVNIRSVPLQAGTVVFSGCCWGALVADLPAVAASEGRPLPVRTPESSLALSFLAAGAQAFVGCTGAHYSPLEPPLDYFGAPMHQAFWRAFTGGSPPAQALLKAKIEYLAGIPHGQPDPVDQAIERKILQQFTCLGLGW